MTTKRVTFGAGLTLLALGAATASHAAVGDREREREMRHEDGVIQTSPTSFTIVGKPARPAVEAAPLAPPTMPAIAAREVPENGGASLALASLDRRIKDLDAEEDARKKELESLGGRIGTAHGRALTRGRSFYRLTRAGMLPVGGGFGELVSHAMRVERSRRALAAELENERQLRARGGELARVLERIARDRVALSGQRAALDAARAQVEDDARRQQAFDRAFATSSAPSGYVAVYGGSGATADAVGAGFAASKGRLLFPLTGRSEVRTSQREGTSGPGLEIKAQLGAPVRAVYAGRVAFAERYGPYGRLVILDHGEHYYTVSGNLGSVDVKVGDEVGAGERIGAVGDEGKGAMLYFEIRRGTETLAPGAWLGI